MELCSADLAEWFKNCLVIRHENILPIKKLLDSYRQYTGSYQNEIDKSSFCDILKEIYKYCADKGYLKT